MPLPRVEGFRSSARPKRLVPYSLARLNQFTGTGYDLGASRTIMFVIIEHAVSKEPTLDLVSKTERVLRRKSINRKTISGLDGKSR